MRGRRSPTVRRNPMTRNVMISICIWQTFIVRKKIILRLRRLFESPLNINCILLLKKAALRSQGPQFQEMSLKEAAKEDSADER